VKPIESFIKDAVCGYRGATEFAKRGIRCIEAKSVRETGLELGAGRCVRKNGKSVTAQRIIRTGDLLIVRSGAGCAGRAIAITTVSEDAVIGGHIYLLRLVNLNPFYAAIFLKGKYGWQQIERSRSGVGALVLDERDINVIQIAMMSELTQKKIEKNYKIVAKWHDKAMNVKYSLIKSGVSRKRAEEDPRFKKFMGRSLSTLEDLIKRTEEIIEGKRKVL